MEAEWRGLAEEAYPKIRGDSGPRRDLSTALRLVADCRTQRQDAQMSIEMRSIRNRPA